MSCRNFGHLCRIFLFATVCLPSLVPHVKIHRLLYPFHMRAQGTCVVGGLNIVSRGIEIQVSEENVEKVTELINAEPQLTNPL